MQGWSHAHEAEASARVALAEVCARLERKGLIVVTDGNVSVRLADGDLLITPSACWKGELSPHEMVRCTPEGVSRGGGRPSSEIAIHVAAYRARADVRAVVHAHPPLAIAHTVAEVSLEAPLMPESWAELGRVPTLPLARPGTADLGAQIEAAARDHDAILMARHGSVTLGEDLARAVGRLEFLEQTAKVSAVARALAGGPVAPLPPDFWG